MYINPPSRGEIDSGSWIRYKDTIYTPAAHSIPDPDPNHIRGPYLFPPAENVPYKITAPNRYGGERPGLGFRVGR